MTEQGDATRVTLLVTQAFEQLGVLKTRSGELDLDYLRKWAKELKVSDLLDRALKQAGT